MSISFTRRSYEGPLVEKFAGIELEGWSATEWEITEDGRSVFVVEIITPEDSKVMFITGEPLESVRPILEACKNRWPELDIETSFPGAKGSR